MSFRGRGESQQDIAIPSLSETKSKHPVVGYIAPLPPIRPEMLRSTNRPAQGVSNPRQVCMKMMNVGKLTREQQMAEFKKFSEEFNKRYGGR